MGGCSILRAEPEKKIPHTWNICYLSECERPIVVFELVLHGSQLGEFGKVGEGLQLPDGVAELLLVLHYEKLQQTQNLDEHKEIERIK